MLKYTTQLFTLYTFFTGNINFFYSETLTLKCLNISTDTEMGENNNWVMKNLNPI